MALYSLELEKHFLSSLINNPSAYFDLDGIIIEGDFFNSSHSVIFSVLRNLILSDEKFDKVLLAQKIKNLGLNLPDNINIFEYVDALAFLKVKGEAIKKIAQELVKFRIFRQIFEAGANVQKLIQAASTLDKPIEDVIGEAETLFLQDISVFDYDAEIENLFDGLEDLVEERGNNPVEESGLITPFYEFNRFYGGIRKGSLFSVASRPGEGKSTLLSYLAFKCSEKTQFKIPALFLDTEMFTVDMKFRFTSMLTGVPVWYLETGNWRKNPEMYQSVRDAWSIIKEFKFFHYRVGAKNIDQISSIIRRWIYSKVKGKINETGEAIVAYDYFKLTGEKIGQNWAEHQALGEKIDKFINLGAKLQFYPLSAIQTNRTGESFNRKAGTFIDDSSAIAGTDKLQQLGSNIGLFRRKTPDEIMLDGPQFGTHLYLNTKARFNGKDSAGHKNVIKRPFPDGSERYVPNYINFEVKNFSVNEKGSLYHVIQSFKEKINLEENKNEGQLM